MSVRSAPGAGFTLIEVLVALAILSLAVVASIQGFAQGLRLLKLAGDHQQAMLLADQKVREVVEVKEGRVEGTEGPLRWERTTRAIEAPDLVPVGGGLQPGRVPGRVYEIDVRVSWDATRQLEIRTLRMVPTETIQGATLIPPAGATSQGGGPGTGAPPSGTGTSRGPFGR